MKDVNWPDLGFAVATGVAVGIIAGLGLGYAAQLFGWSTKLIGPVTGGVTGALTPMLYQARARRRARSADGR